jgi:hypothetical protein
MALLLFRNKKRFRRNNFTSNSRNLQGKQRHLRTKWEPSPASKKCHRCSRLNRGTTKSSKSCKYFFVVRFCPIILHIMLRDLLTQKCVHKIKVTDFGYPRACRFRKYQIENRSPELFLFLFVEMYR